MFTKNIRAVIIILIFMLCMTLIGGCDDNHQSKHQTINYSTYRQDMLRFDLNLKSGEYEFRTEKDNPPFECSHVDELYNKDDEFSKSSEIIKVKQAKILYGKYLFTKENDYIFTKIDGEFGWIKYEVPIDKKYKNYIVSFFNHKEIAKNISFIEVLPFNNEQFVLIFDEYEQYILDLEKKKITWVRGAYYEAPDINFKTDMLECGGDLSATTYIFNKFGELVNEF